MSIKIDKPELFKEMLKTGINLFTGAGFSKLPDSNGNVLPDAQNLCNEICKEFSVSKTYSDDLERLSNIINLRAKQQFQNYLRSKYTVSSYNCLYDNLNLIRINSFITTNIDNIVQCVMDRSSIYCLHNIVEYGAVKKSSHIIPFIPLHGNVKDLNSHLYFGKSELANVDDDNKELFHTMHSKLLEAPTLFWGYGFHDNAIERTISKLLEKNKHSIWIQCLPENKNIDYFRDLGCYIIEGTTEELLIWINENSKTSQEPVGSLESIESIKDYLIPTRNQIETVSLEDYYVGGCTHWYCILSRYPYETKSVNALYENVLSNKNIIAIGIPFSGKTTTMMQLAAKVNADIKIIVSDISLTEAQRIINVLNSKDAFVFIDNCCDDANITKLFMKQPNLKVVGFSDDYAFESSKHLFEPIDYTRIEIGELEISEAQRIFENIPQILRKEKFSYKDTDEEKFSMLEMISKNVKGILTEERIKILLERLLDDSVEGFEIVSLAIYLVHNKSSLNTDVLCSFFNTTDYSRLTSLLSKAEGYLNEMNVELLPDQYDQNYYNIRSVLFAHLAFEVLINSFKTQFSEVIKKFTINVAPYKIYRYYIFKRSAYDARLFKLLFKGNAHILYEHISHFDESAYTLQQWALYKAYLGDYSGAFSDIDKAINISQNNFSIRNSRAIILFEANKTQKTKIAQERICEAMDILQQCFTSDKRKVYHAQKYAEYALFLAKEQNNTDYIKQAKDWLESIIKTKESTSIRTKQLLKEVKEIVECQSHKNLLL